MKKFMFHFLFTIFACVNIVVAHADTETIQWYSDGQLYDTNTCQSGADIEIPSTTPTKLGYTFVGWEEAYIPIEYIEGVQNTQYIDTGVIPVSSMKMYVKFQYVNTTSSSYNVFGARNQTYTGVTCFVSDANDTIQADWFSNKNDNTNRWTQTIGVSSNDIFEYNMENSGCKIIKNGSLVATHKFSPDNTTSYSLFLNGVNMAGVPNNSMTASGRIYAFKIWNSNGTPIRDMIPVLDSNNVPCMYDKVTNQFYYNAGTGNFIAGPVITE